MKQKDIALIAVMVVLGAVVSLVISRMIFSSPKNRSQKAEVVDVINSTFTEPSSKYFNDNAIDPTAHIQIPATPAGSNSSSSGTNP